MIKNKNKGGKIAILQVILLITSIFAIAWMFGGSVEVVSALDGSTCTVNGEQGICTVSDSCGGTSYGTETCGEEFVCCITPSEEDDKSGLSVGDLAKAGGIYSVGKGVAKKIPALSAPTTEAATGSVFGTVGEGSLGINAVGSASTAADKPALLLGGGTTAGSIVAIAAWSAVAFVLGRYVLGPMLGLDVQNSQALGYSLAAGTATALALTIFASSSVGGPLGWAIGGVVAGVTFLILARKSSADIISYSCYAWDAQTGGDNCEVCNNQEIECTPYQCHSLGQACEFEVDELTGQPSCFWNNPNDIIAPIITPREDSLIDKNIYRYTPDNTISPPDTGVKVEYVDSQDGCAPAWTPVSFGIELDDRARCKISPGTIFDSYEEMPDLFLSNGIMGYNHSFSLSLPSQEALEAENITVENGGIYDFYVRCMDPNGNTNPSNFGFNFCIDEGPDTLAPLIDHTTPLNETPFASGQSEFDVEVYVNEPSQCRWSNTDKSYDAMENNFNCATSVLDSNPQNLYRCSGTITNLRDNQNNDFYFRCKDQPHLAGTNESLRNTNQQSYHYRLIGTQDLEIQSVSPNDETISDSTDLVPVEISVRTRVGYDDGRAVCAVSDTGEEGTFINFFYGQGVEPYSQHEHSQILNLDQGNYSYQVRCCDLGNNCDQRQIQFGVETDTSSPQVVRAYKDNNNLRIITDEEGSCVYSTSPSIECSYNFNDGIAFNSINLNQNNEHYADWPENIQTTYYVKCEDSYGNRPASNQCNIVIRPFEIPGVQSQ